MFTGLIEDVGTIEGIEPTGGSMRLRIATSLASRRLEHGESIAVDGCCLTVETFDDRSFSAFASIETMRKTTLGDRSVGSAVNLERALTLERRLGGHLVSGHVDGTGTFLGATFNDEAWEVWVAADASLLDHCVAKGSVCLDGISLTLVEVLQDRFSLWIIPETWNRTTLARRAPGDRVNIETDLLAKYIFRCLEVRGAAPPNASDERIARILGSGGWGG